MQKNQKKDKLLLIGWDSADWKIIGPLLSQGLMPSLKKLIDNGVYGNMSTMNPPFSPMLWSSVATGKTPDKHGVLGFIEVKPGSKGVRPVTTNSRKSRALWNILHNQGLKSNVVGWWPSFPAEPVNGVVVSDKFQKVNPDPSKQSPLVKGIVHPEHIIDELKDLRMFPFEITKEHILPFIPQAAKIDQEKDNGLKAFSKILSQNTSVHNASTYLLRKTDWDFMAIYFDMIDHFCHAFMKYHPPKLSQIDQGLFDIYKDTVAGAYRFQDMMLGRVLDLIDDDTTVIIMSDHGFESGNKRIMKMPKVAAAPALDHRQFGIFVASGPNIKKNEKIFGLGLIDIAPTILHHFDLPVGKDMDGKVILEIFKNTKPPKYIESWEKVAGDFGELKKEEIVDAFSDEEAMEQLVELGYVERPDEKIETAVHKTRCDLKHNLARVYLGKKNYEKAKDILLELIQEKEPIDTAPYFMDLINVFLGLKNYDAAEKYLEDFKLVKTEVKYNTYFIQAQILTGKEQHLKALKILMEAKGKKPNAELWFRIGSINLTLQNFEEAQTAFENAIEIESDKAKYHRGMAEALFELGEYEECAEYALTSIELVKYFPAAHYILGRALEKLGDLENAKIAYNTAASLKPKTFPRAEKALENIEEKITTPLDLRDKTHYKHRDGQITIVSGLPRSGTSLMMQMLNKGGLTSLTDKKREADKSNPKGYYEYEPVMSIHKDNSWLHLAQNKSVKIVAPLLKFLDPQYRYKIIFMVRDLDEVIISQQKMRSKASNIFPVQLYNTYRKQLEAIEKWKNKEPGVEIIYVDYKDVLGHTMESIDKVVSFVGTDLDKNKMDTCVDKSLYRNKAIGS